MNIQKKITLGLDAILYYTINSFVFDTKRLQALHAELTPSDQEIFNFDHNGIVWDDYVMGSVVGARRHFFHEDDQTLEKARKKHRMLFVIHWVLVVVFSVAALNFFSQILIKYV